MFISRSILTCFFFATSLFSGFQAFAQSSPSDPSGTWRWNYELNGASREDALSLYVEDGKLAGSFLGASGKPVAVKDGKIKDNQFSCTAEYASEGQTIGLAFSGKVRNDDIDGTLAVTVEGGTEEFGWTPKRSVRAEDVVGRWNIIIETDDRKMEPYIVIKQEDKALKGKYTLVEGVVVDVTELKIRDNKLEFRIDTTYDGRKIRADFSGRPYGRSVKGKIKYELDDDEGEIEFTATRQAEKK